MKEGDKVSKKPQFRNGFGWEEGIVLDISANGTYFRFSGLGGGSMFPVEQFDVVKSEDSMSSFDAIVSSPLMDELKVIRTLLERIADRLDGKTPPQTDEEQIAIARTIAATQNGSGL